MILDESPVTPDSEDVSAVGAGIELVMNLMKIILDTARVIPWLPLGFKFGVDEDVSGDGGGEGGPVGWCADCVLGEFLGCTEVKLKVAEESPECLFVFPFLSFWIHRDEILDVFEAVVVCCL